MNVPPPPGLKAYAEWLSKHDHYPPDISLDSLSSADLYQVCGKAWNESLSPFLLSVHLIEFIVAYLSQAKVTRALLPRITDDLLPYCLSRGLRLETLIAAPPLYSVPPGDDRTKHPAIRWSDGEAHEVAHRVPERYDVVICDMALANSEEFLPPRPPIPDDAGPEGSVEKTVWKYQDERAWLEEAKAELMAGACGHLKPEGGTALLLDSSDLFRKPQTVLRRLETSGLGVAGVIDVPPNNWASGSAQLVILSRATSPETVFAGALSESAERNAVLLSNFVSRGPGTDPALGTLIPRHEYVSLRRAAIQQKIWESFEKLGLPREPLRNLFDADKSGWVEPLDADEGDPPNCIYLPLSPSPRVRTSRSGVRTKRHEYLRVVLRPEKMEAEFVAAFLNSDLGRLVRRAYVGLEARRVLGDNLVGHMPILVADLTVRTRALEADTLARNVIAEARRQQDSLWAYPQRADDVKRAIRRLGSSDTLQTDWFETLPFPLASILWEHHARGDDPARQCTVLLQFFDGLAEFWATVLLSGFSRDRTHWDRVCTMFQDEPGQSRGGLTVATLGTWTHIVKILSGRTRKMLRDANEITRCQDMFRTDNDRFLTGLSSEGLVERLREVKELRNTWTHSGLPSPNELRGRNATLESALVQHFRPTLTSTWEDTRLVQAHEARKMGTERYSQKVSLLTGTRVPFKRETINVPEMMDDGGLYLLTDDRQQPLKLKPFVKILPGPRTARDACYFYSRQQANGIRYVSYHYEAEAEVIDAFQDTAAALDEFVRK